MRARRTLIAVLPLLAVSTLHAQVVDPVVDSREFFQMKHRMLEYLASELGFTIFSIEANMPEA
jgi:hypothetical protein